jgi:hypothetical protein
VQHGIVLQAKRILIIGMFGSLQSLLWKRGQELDGKRSEIRLVEL